MGLCRHATWVVWTTLALVLCACHKKAESPAPDASRPSTILLGIHVGNVWGGGYSIRVFPGEYAIIEHPRCADARKTEVSAPLRMGLCTIRLDKEQSARFEAAMEPFRRYAVPLTVETVAATQTPDGKACRRHVTDQDQVGLLWVDSKGASIAGFDTGCDPAKFAEFYKSLNRVANTLPIKEILAKS